MSRNDRICIILIIAFSILFSIIVFAVTPLCDAYCGGHDKHVFMAIGREVYRGAILYKDIYELKGPFFLFYNAAAFMMNSNIFYYFTSLLFMIITLIYVYRIARLRCEHFSSLFVSFIAFAYIFSNDSFKMLNNVSVEFIQMPLIAISYFVYLKDSNINRMDSLVLGLFCGLLVLSRINDAAISVIIFIVHVARLFYKKDYKIIISFIAMYLIGFLIAIMPFVCYFVKNNAMDSFIFMQFIHPIKYGSISLGKRMETIKHFVSNMYIFLVYSVYLYYAILKKEYIDNFVIFVFCFVFVLILPGRTFGHYAIAMFPLIVFPLSIVFEKFRFKELAKFNRNNLMYIFLMFSSVIIIVGVLLASLICHIQKLTEIDSDSKQIIEYVKNNTNSNESILALSNNYNLNYYCDRISKKTPYTFWPYETVFIPSIEKTIRNGEFKIIILYSGEINNSIYRDIIIDNFSLAMNNDSYDVYILSSSNK